MRELAQPGAHGETFQLWESPGSAHGPHGLILGCTHPWALEQVPVDRGWGVFLLCFLLRRGLGSRSERLPSEAFCGGHWLVCGLGAACRLSVTGEQDCPHLLGLRGGAVSVRVGD